MVLIQYLAKIKQSTYYIVLYVYSQTHAQTHTQSRTHWSHFSILSPSIQNEMSPAPLIRYSSKNFLLKSGHILLYATFSFFSFLNSFNDYFLKNITLIPLCKHEIKQRWKEGSLINKIYKKSYCPLQFFKALFTDILIFHFTVLHTSHIKLSTIY